MRVSACRPLKESTIWVDWALKNDELVPGILCRLRKEARPPQIRLCATREMVAVATGRIEGFVHVGPMPFDIAAAGLVVEAAGGVVTDCAGNPWTAFSPSIVATNGIIHEDLLRLIAAK